MQRLVTRAQSKAVKWLLQGEKYATLVRAEKSKIESVMENSITGLAAKRALRGGALSVHSPRRRSFWAVALIAVYAAGCAGSSVESEANDSAVVQSPPSADEEPVWADGPIDDRRAPRDETETSDGSEAARNATAEQPRRLEEIFPGESITLDFRQTEIRRVMRIFRVKATVDLVLTSDVEGRLTVRTEEIPIVDAFRAVLRAGKLTYELRGRTIVVRPGDSQ